MPRCPVCATHHIDSVRLQAEDRPGGHSFSREFLVNVGQGHRRINRVLVLFYICVRKKGVFPERKDYMAKLRGITRR